MKFEKIPDEPLRSEDDPAYDEELWRPTWKCYCCHDTGFILPRLAEQIFDRYRHGKSKFPRCTATACKTDIGTDKRLLASTNFNVPVHICDYFDRLERQDWNDWVMRQAKLIKNNKDKAKSAIEELSKSMAVRSPRTSAEQMLAQQQHQNVLVDL